MNTLFIVKFNWQLFFGIIVLLYLVFPNISWYSFIAIAISLHQFILLFNALGYFVPVRYLFGAYMCLQMLVGPMFAYNGLDKFQPVNYQMKIPEAAYFLYVIPAAIAFIVGLHIFAGKLDGEQLKVSEIQKFVNKNDKLPYFFIGIGFLASFVANIFSADMAFIFYLLGGFKFIGAFMLIIGSRQLKIIPLVLIYSSIILSSLSQAMFHDLLTWLMFLGSVFSIRYKPNLYIKRLAVFGFIIFSIAIQQLKGGYRAATWERGEETGVATLSNAYEESNSNKTFFSYQSLAKNNVRINQGYIITNIMKTVPNIVPFEGGSELYKILEAAILPRFLAPNKLNAGDRELFMKYTGMRIARGTSMGLSSVGDAYINFGIVGGCIFMFFLGLLYSEVLKAFYRYSKYFPILLLFTPLVFYYPIRPDCELQTILGHLVKSCFLIFIIFVFWKNKFGITVSGRWRKSVSS